MIGTRHCFLFRIECASGEHRQHAGALPCAALVCRQKYRRRWVIIGDYVATGEPEYFYLRFAPDTGWRHQDRGRWRNVAGSYGGSLSNLYAAACAAIQEKDEYEIDTLQDICFQTWNGEMKGKVPVDIMQALQSLLDAFTNKDSNQ
jgi:hypothetical protein